MKIKLYNLEELKTCPYCNSDLGFYYNQRFTRYYQVYYYSGKKFKTVDNSTDKWFKPDKYYRCFNCNKPVALVDQSAWI